MYVAYRNNHRVVRKASGIDKKMFVCTNCGIVGPSVMAFTDIEQCSGKPANAL